MAPRAYCDALDEQGVREIITLIGSKFDLCVAAGNFAHHSCVLPSSKKKKDAHVRGAHMESVEYAIHSGPPETAALSPSERTAHRLISDVLDCFSLRWCA